MHPEDFTRRAAVGLAVAAAATAQAHAMGITPKGEKAMERVTGIGGFFFRAKDPKALAHWYEDNLGILPVPTKYDMPAWETEAGTTVFAPFPKDTSYFGDPAQQWMLNFRVRESGQDGGAIAGQRHHGGGRSGTLSKWPVRQGARSGRQPDPALAAGRQGAWIGWSGHSPLPGYLHRSAN